MQERAPISSASRMFEFAHEPSRCRRVKIRQLMRIPRISTISSG